MPIESLTPAQRRSLARDVLRVLAELWLDQHGMEGEISINLKGEPQ